MLIRLARVSGFAGAHPRKRSLALNLRIDCPIECACIAMVKQVSSSCGQKRPTPRCSGGCVRPPRAGHALCAINRLRCRRSCAGRAAGERRRAMVQQVIKNVNAAHLSGVRCPR